MVLALLQLQLLFSIRSGCGWNRQFYGCNSYKCVTDNYLSISDQTITAGTVPLSLGGTGANTASAARSALGVDAAGTDNSTDVSLCGVTDNYLSISDQTITAGTVPLSLGGTGATTASAARSALGVDAAGTDNSTDVILRVSLTTISQLVIKPLQQVQSPYHLVVLALLQLQLLVQHLVWMQLEQTILPM